MSKNSLLYCINHYESLVKGNTPFFFCNRDVTIRSIFEGDKKRLEPMPIPVSLLASMETFSNKAKKTFDGVIIVETPRWTRKGSFDSLTLYVPRDGGGGDAAIEYKSNKKRKKGNIRQFGYVTKGPRHNENWGEMTTGRNMVTLHFVQVDQHFPRKAKERKNRHNDDRELKKFDASSCLKRRMDKIKPHLNTFTHLMDRLGDKKITIESYINSGCWGEVYSIGVTLAKGRVNRVAMKVSALPEGEITTGDERLA